MDISSTLLPYDFALCFTELALLLAFEFLLLLSSTEFRDPLVLSFPPSGSLVLFSFLALLGIRVLADLLVQFLASLAKLGTRLGAEGEATRFERVDKGEDGFYERDGRSCL